MKFSILIANYNNATFLEECILSAINQSYQDLEIVIIDDASTDDSLTIINEFVSRDNRIKYFRNETNMGCGYTKRKCIEKASGTICGFLDSDDLLYPKAVEIMVSEHVKHVDASLIYSSYEIYDESLKLIRKNQYFFHEDSLFFMIGIGLNHFASFKRELYDKTLGINEFFPRSVDRDLYLKLEEVGETIFVPEYLYKYRLNSNSISNNENAYKAEYWAWQARFAACERRNLNKEEIYAIIMSQIMENTKGYDFSTTTDYKLGKRLLFPFRFIKNKIFKH